MALLGAGIVGVAPRPAPAAEPLRILGLESTPGGWRITWQSLTGASYELQRWDGVSADPAGYPAWEPVTRILAVGPTASYEELPSPTGRRFYRIAQGSAGPAPDLTAPSLAGFRAELLGATAGSSLRLSATATDPSGIQSVVFLADSTVLAPPQQVRGLWTLEIPYASVAQAGRLSAQATDAAGNTAVAHTRVPRASDLAQRFVPLNAAGRPVSGATVTLAPGALPPLRYLPGGALTERETLAVSLPRGAQLITSGGREVLRFHEAEIRLGRDAALQLHPTVATAGARAPHGGIARHTITAIEGGVRIISASPLDLPVGPVSAADLEVLLGLAPGDGVPMRVFEHFDLRWHAGVLEDSGIRGGRFHFAGLPLPVLSGDYPDHVVPLAGVTELRLPYHGRFPWSGAGADAPELRLSAADPGWLILRPDGTLGWRNRSELRLSGGSRVRVEARLDDPLYRFGIVADGVQVPLLGNLADLILPDDPGACLQPGLDAAALTRATGCLEALGLAYFNVSASAVAAAPVPDDPDVGGLPLPPDDLDTSVSVLNAWGHRAVAAAGPALPMAPQRELFTHTGQSAAAATDLAAATRHRAALARAAAALEAGGLTGTTEDVAALNAALEEATAAALLRARDASGVVSHAALLETLEALVETQGLLAEAGRPQNTALHAAAGELLWRFLERRLEDWGILAGQFVPAPGSVISGMNRFTVFQHLNQLLDALAQAALLGFDEPFPGPMDEAFTQMALRLWALLDAGLAEAEAAGDIHGFLYAFEDLLDLQAWRQASIFPNRPELAPIPMPGTAAYLAVFARLDALLVADLARPYGERTLNNEQVQLRRLGRILRDVPAGVTLASPPFERAHERFNARIAEAVAQPDLLSAIGPLVALIELGILNEELRRRMNLPATADWDGSQLPVLLGRLAEVGRAQRGWSELNRGRQLLLQEARRLGLTGDAARQRHHLEQAVPVLHAARDVAVALWESERNRRELSTLDVADLLLPGDLRIEKAAGAAMGDRQAGWISGSFRGRLALPKFDGRLEVLNASFDQDGTFNLAAHGSAGFRGVTFGLTRRQPLTVSWRAPGPLRLQGEGILGLPNGMSFAARVQWDDPTYGFRFEARDLRFELARQLTVLRPTLDAAVVSQAGDSLRWAYIDYFASMNAALEGLARQAGTLPDLGPGAVGEPPDFEAPQFTIPFSEVNAWANSALLTAQENVNRSHALTVAGLRDALQTLRDDATLAAETLETEARFLEFQQQRLTAHRGYAEALARINDTLLFGDETEAVAFRETAREAVRAEARLHFKHLLSRPPQNLAESSRHIRVLLDIAAAGQATDASFEDIDEDGFPNATDNCPALWSSQPLPDADNDGFGDACDPAPQDAAVPGTGPCAEALRLVGQAQPQVQALLSCQVQRELAELGYDPASGNQVDPARLEILPAEALDERVALLLRLESDVQAVGLPSDHLPFVRRDVLERLIALRAEELRDTPESDTLRRYEIALELVNLKSFGDEAVTLDSVLGELRAATGNGPRISYEEFLRLDEMFGKRRAARREALEGRLDRVFGQDLDSNLLPLDRAYRRGVVGDSLELLKAAWDGLRPENAEFRTHVDGFIRHRVQQLRDNLVDPEFLAGRLGDARFIATALADATGWAAATLPGTDPLVEDLRLALEDFTLRLTSVAEARRAWWLLREYAEVLDRTLRDHGAAMGASLRATLQQSFAASILASDRVLTALSTLADAVGAEAFKAQLPGDLRVRRVFGGVVYDRTTEAWSGSFGGRLEFPEFQKAFFEISQATLATDGSFQIAAATGGPLPFGRLGLTAGLQIAGSMDGLQSISGSGQLAVPLDAVTNLYAVAVGYDFGNRRLRFDTQATGLDWRVSEDFVLFHGGFGVEFSTAEPDGAVTFRGSAGLFAREEPLPATLTRTNFHLTVTNAAVRLAGTETTLSVALTNGTLLLPEFFRTSLGTTNRILTNFLASPQGQTSQLASVVLSNSAALSPQIGPAISLVPTNPVMVSIQYPSGQLTVSGALQFRDLGFQVPGFASLEFAVAQARLVFATNQLPYLTNLHGALQFPLPNQTNILEVADAAVSLNGLPTGTVRLRTNLDLYRDNDWRLTLLGRESILCPTGTGLTLRHDPAFGGQLVLRLDAGMEFAIPASVLTDANGGALALGSCGSLTIPVNQAPLLSLDSLGLALGSARLGGPQGITLTNASLQLAGLTNLFSPSPSQPFEARLGGALLLGGAGLGLSNAVFRFEGSPLPRFTVSELAVVQPGSLLGLGPDFPMHLDEGRVRFQRDDLPLPGLLAATNLAVTVSGSAALPPGPNPVLGSRVNDLVITFLPDGQPRFSLDGIGFTVDLTALIGDSLPLTLGGNLYIGGLNPPPNTPPSYLFSGRLKGNFKGNAVEGLAALDACGLRGVCFGLAGAEVNIPLAYGFVLTGARGGISLANANSDPCSFLDQLPIDPITGRPTGSSPCTAPPASPCPPILTLADLRSAAPSPAPQIAGASSAGPTAEPRPLELANRHRAPASTTTPAIPCPVLGECPPASVNILCMPHPEHGEPGSPHAHRVIYKFTSLDEPLLNGIGITPEAVAALVPEFRLDPHAIALDLAAMFRSFVDAATPRAPSDAPESVRAVDAAIAAALDQVELGFANAVLCATRNLPASSPELAGLLYGAIRDTAYAGVACQDVTVQLEGAVSYTGLASFANVTGGLVLSSTGSAGLVGSVNVLGIPVGRARAFVNQTDDQGNPILPSMCGELVAALGPLELGSLAYLNDCPDCTTALFSAFANLPARLSDAYTLALMEQAHPDLAQPGLNAGQHLARLDTPERQMAFLAAMMGTPPRDPDGQIPAAFLEFIVELAEAVQPRWAMCGEVQPKLFGFPLSGGGKLYGYQFYAGPNLVNGQRQGYLLRDAYSFSPIQMMANYALAAFTAGLGSLFVPAVDEAQVSTSLLLPTFGQIAREGFTLPPAEFAARRTRDFLANATQTLSYRLAPFGMELGRAGGRILLPSLDHHPRGPAPRTPPELRGQGLPGELDVLLAALGDKDATNAVNRLSDITWRGEGDADFTALFAGTRYETAVARRNLSLRDDYFPHGGFLGAGLMDFPALLASPLPPSLAVALDASQPAATRLTALQDFISNHLLKTVRVGEMAFYIPAPNPPVDRFPTTPQALVESLRNFLPSDPLQVSSYYPVEDGFFRGWIEAPVLGLPTVRSHAVWQPQQGLIRLDAEVPAQSWFNRYLNQASFVVELRGNTNQADTVLALFTPLSNQVARLSRNSPGLETTLGDIARRLPNDLAAGLPKVALTLSAAQVRIPVPTYSPALPLTDALTVARIQNATVEAYSPFYRRPGATGNGPLDRARRDGGIAVQGDFNFLNGVVQVSGAEFAVTPNPDPLGLPVVTGSLAGEGLTLFGIPFGPPPAAAPALHDAHSGGAQIDFRSDARAARLDARGSVPSLNLGPLLALTPLSGTTIGATASFETTTSALPKGSLALQACRLTVPLLGSTLAIVHGASTNDAFTLDTTGPWKAAVTLPSGPGLDLRLGNQRILRLSRSTAATGLPFLATLSGEGLTSGELMFTNLNLGLVLETYPDAAASDPRRRTVALAPGAEVSLRLASDGTFDFRATIPQLFPLTGTPLAALDAGFELRLRETGLSFQGTAGGGLWSALGGAPLEVTVNLNATGLTFLAEGGLPPLTFGVFQIDNGTGGGPTVTLRHDGIALPSGLSLRLNLAALGSPTLTLPPFTIGTSGAFTATAQGAANPSYDGLVFSSATHQLTRNTAGVVSYAFAGEIPPRTLTGFGSIAPRSGSNLRATVSASSTGTVTLAMDAALLRLTGVGLTVDALLHGAGNTNAPFGFSSTGPWSATATFSTVVADPPGTSLPEFLRLTPGTASEAALFSASVNGDQGNLTSVTATRTGNVNLELFRNSPLARTLSNVNAGTIAFTVTNSPRQVTITLDPPDLTWSTNFVVNSKPVTVDLFRLSSGKLTVNISSSVTGDQSVKLAAPSLTLLPGSALEQTLSALPDQTLRAASISIVSGSPSPTLAFPGLPVIRLHTTPLSLRADGFASPLTFQYGTNYSSLLSFSATTSSLSLEFAGNRLRLRVPFGLPGSAALGKSVQLVGGESILEVSTTGEFLGTFKVASNTPRNLASSVLGFEPSGTLTLTGSAASTSPNFELAGNLQLGLAYPNPANPAQTLTVQRNLAFSLAAAEDFAATVTSGLPSFNLGWLRVQPGGDGQVTVTRSGADGTFAVAFEDWDVRLLGVDYNNQDLSLSSVGILSRNLPASTFNLGSGTGAIRLVTGSVLPLDWVVNTAAAAAGRTLLDLPASTSLSLPGVPGLSGTLRDGLGFNSALADIPATGIFDRTWTRTLTLNGLDFGSVTARLQRAEWNGPITLTVSRANALWSGLNLQVSANTGDAASFSASLKGTFAVGDWNFGNADFTYVGTDPTAPFQGSATITDPTGTVGFTLGIKLRAGAKPCLEFDFGGLKRTLCLP